MFFILPIVLQKRNKCKPNTNCSFFFIYIDIYIFAEVALRGKWHYTKCSKTKSEDQPMHPHSFTTVIPVIHVRILKICTTEANSPVCENMHVDLYRSCEGFFLSSVEDRVKIVEYRVKLVEYRVNFVEYRVNLVEYQVKLVEYRVNFVEYRVNLVEYRVKLVEYRVNFVEYRVNLVEYQVKLVEYRVKIVEYRVKIVEYRVNVVEYRVKII